MTYTIYHNPRCSKSREALQLLRDAGVEPEIIEYLATPPDVKTLKGLLRKLGCGPNALIRRKDARALGVDLSLADDDLIALMAANPQIIERPIVVNGPRAVLGRPPQNVRDQLSCT